MGDVAVRLVFFDMLAERHRPCDALGMCNCDSPRAAHDPGAPQCGGTWGKRNVRVKDIKGGEYSPETDASALRYRPYKFAVTMENALVPGYVTEKPIAALLADTIPIYFGAGLSRRGGGPWLNAERMVVCDVSEDTLYALRSLEPPFEPRSGGGGGYGLDFLTNGTARARAARALLEPELAPCVDEVIRLDTDSAAFERVLRRPKLPTGRGWTDLSRLGRQLREAARGLGSYLPLDAGDLDVYAQMDAAQASVDVS